MRQSSKNTEFARAITFLVPVLAFAQVPVFQSDSRIVEIPVVAKDSQGAPVADLRKGDLRVFDNNSEQSILSFEKLDANGMTANGDPLASSVTMRHPLRTTIILLDAINSDTADRARSRNAISAMLRDLPQGRDRIAIFVLGDELQLLHGFSTNVASLRAAVDGLTGELAATAVADRVPFSGGFALSATHVLSTPDSNAEIRRSRTLEALIQIARKVNDVSGRKSLLWVTGGFLSPEEHGDVDAAVREMTAAKVMLYPIDARGLLSCPPTGCSPEINQNIASMEELAQETGGRAYHDDNDISALARAAIDDSREGYLLTYSPNNYKPGGLAHEIQLKSSRKGIDLRFRPAYVPD